MEQIYIGCDLHKRTSNLCIKTKSGQVIEECKIPTTKEKFQEALSVYAGAHIVFEPVSQSWWLGDVLEELGLVVSLANAREVKAIAHAKVKNDRIDARVLCDLLRNEYLPESYRSSREARIWKEQVRFRASLIAQRTQLRNKIHALLSRRGIRPPYGMLFGKKGIAWLAALELPPVERSHLSHYLSLLSSFEEAITAATTSVEHVASNHEDAQLLMSIPGVSYVSAVSILSEIDHIDRFPSGRQLASYAGLTPRVYASGEHTRYGRISKKGSKILRTILVEVAHCQQRLKQKRGLRTYFMRVCERKGNRTATVATARKLCVIIYGILSSKTPFDDNRIVA